MSLTKFEKDMSIIRKEPNQVIKQADRLKANFDKAGEEIKEYINNTLTTEIDAEFEKKVNKEYGKGLSSNDYTDSEKSKLGNLPTSAELNNRMNLKADKEEMNNLLSDKVDKEEGKGLSSNDYTDSEKSKLGNLPTSAELNSRMNSKADKEEMNNLLSDKVDKEEGKGLSSNDYTDGEKSKLGNLPTAAELNNRMNLKADKEEMNNLLAGKVDKVEGKGLSSNDYTDSEKSKLGNLPTSAELNNRMNLKADKEEMNNLLAGKVDKEDGKGLSSNDYTDSEKSKLGNLPTAADLNSRMNLKADINELNKNFSNVLKGEGNDISLKNTGVSPIEHEMDIYLSSNTVTDFSSVTVTRYGKNIIPYPYITTSKEQAGVKYTDNGDGTITVSGNATAYCDFILYHGVPLVKNGYITFSAGKEFTNMMINIEIYNSSNTIIKNFSYFYNTHSIKINLSDYSDIAKWRIYIKRGENGNVSGTICPQIEIGEFATEYEKYKEPISVKAQSDGSVKGITSLYPTTSLITDNGDVTINCKYNRDINMAFAELQQAIISLGGNV